MDDAQFRTAVDRSSLLSDRSLAVKAELRRGWLSSPSRALELWLPPPIGGPEPGHPPPIGGPVPSSVVFMLDVSTPSDRLEVANDRVRPSEGRTGGELGD